MAGVGTEQRARCWVLVVILRNSCSGRGLHGLHVESRMHIIAHRRVCVLMRVLHSLLDNQHVHNMPAYRPICDAPCSTTSPRREGPYVQLPRRISWGFPKLKDRAITTAPSISAHATIRRQPICQSGARPWKMAATLATVPTPILPRLAARLAPTPEPPRGRGSALALVFRTMFYVLCALRLKAKQSSTPQQQTVTTRHRSRARRVEVRLTESR
jgi:hypothetical protein